ncbi:MAG: hypothetical protein H7Y02_05665 [Candidatus Obscuribacterales bacterium]|nr:hypothetical protein [Steroidobacteraceae bacterium]
MSATDLAISRVALLTVDGAALKGDFCKADVTGCGVALVASEVVAGVTTDFGKLCASNARLISAIENELRDVGLLAGMESLVDMTRDVGSAC